MKAKVLLTGRPGCGKTILIKRVVKEFALPAGGFYTEEIRERGRIIPVADSKFLRVRTRTAKLLRDEFCRRSVSRIQLRPGLCRSDQWARWFTRGVRLAQGNFAR
jgi:predicted ATPase